MGKVYKNKVKWLFLLNLFILYIILNLNLGFIFLGFFELIIVDFFSNLFWLIISVLIECFGVSMYLKIILSFRILEIRVEF